jgi:ligand-binding sensor domain-containing protein
MTSIRVITGAAVLLLALGYGRATSPADNRLRFDHLTVEDGLSHTGVMAIRKDSHGFVWVGTPDGLNRYDGSAFVTYRSDPQDPNSLASSIGGVLYEDRQRRLWVGSSWSGAGVSLLDREHERFRRFVPAPGKRPATSALDRGGPTGPHLARHGQRAGQPRPGERRDSTLHARTRR